ncbi:uncharacterized protein Dmoj_GI25984 [Drosophila mojavensis]|uniref:Uncharacterized protein n=1 Tax=Drosophila mojavensis TaxID=7230 RepID=A0A0Q9X3S8_DROMO|nr:uncharacterized protein Dmoj_GI25984 [Drosophila mojavensis]
MPLTAGTVARSNSNEWLLPTPTRGANKCATVTMLLAQRIARNDCWSVDAEPRYGSNKMNVWQTLEYLSGLSLRKRYNYEGYVDTQHLIRTLTPSWRRDSYAEKTKAEEANAAGTGPGKAKYPAERGIESVADVVVTTMVRGMPSYQQSTDNLAPSQQGVAKAVPRRRHRSRRKTTKSTVVAAEYALTQDDLQDLVKCT